uniref:Uncharacterized protein n=1 Tax=Cucumis melo TaxID=3656 RepID=A0A9I9ED70_CUCME
MAVVDLNSNEIASMILQSKITQNLLEGIHFNFGCFELDIKKISNGDIYLVKDNGDVLFGKETNNKGIVGGKANPNPSRRTLAAVVVGRHKPATSRVSHSLRKSLPRAVEVSVSRKPFRHRRQFFSSSVRSPPPGSRRRWVCSPSQSAARRCRFKRLGASVAVEASHVRSSPLSKLEDLSHVAPAVPRL